MSASSRVAEYFKVQITSTIVVYYYTLSSRDLSTKASLSPRASTGVNVPSSFSHSLSLAVCVCVLHPFFFITKCTYQQDLAHFVFISKLIIGWFLSLAITSKIITPYTTIVVRHKIYKKYKFFCSKKNQWVQVYCLATINNCL